MADGLNYLIEDAEKEDIETILESGDYSPTEWEQKFLGDMLPREYISLKQRECLDKILKKFNFM